MPLDIHLEWVPEREEEFFSSIPHHAGVFLIETRTAGIAAAGKPYLARTADLRHAAERFLRPPDPLSKRLNLREVAAAFHFRLTGSRFEQSLGLYHEARALFPKSYRAFLRLRGPALLKISLRNNYPRCYVTRRILRDSGYYFGPFVSRQTAESFASEFLDLFKIRRCKIKIRRDPAFPGCIYSEMKMCLAPCFAGCTAEDYCAEVRRVVESFETNGASLVSALERERDAASETTDFERAAALHKKLEKTRGVLRGFPEIARRIDALNAVILQRAAAEKTVAIFPLADGIFTPPFFLSFGESSQPHSIEELLRHHFDDLQSKKTVALEHPPGTAGEREEHLSLLAHWFYSKPRAGEILFRGTDWPYRKILRACARLLASPPGPADVPPCLP